MNVTFVHYFHVYCYLSGMPSQNVPDLAKKEKITKPVESIDENVTWSGIVEKFITYPSVRLLINIFVKC